MESDSTVAQGAWVIIKLKVQSSKFKVQSSKLKAQSSKFKVKSNSG